MIYALLAAAAVIQPADEPPPPPEVVQSAEAWTECLGTGVDSAPANRSARDAARAVLAACNAMQVRMVEAHGRWIDGSALSERGKQDARAAMQRSLAGMESQLTQAIRASRAD